MLLTFSKIIIFVIRIKQEFGACRSFFNITCPQEQGLVHSAVFSQIPSEIPPASVIIRVRLVSVNAQNEKNVAICKQIKLQVI